MASDPMVPVPCSIRRVLRETSDTFTCELVPADGPTRLGFRPGQFNMVYIFGVGEIPISISGDPRRADRVVHTTRAVGTVTRAMQQLHEGSMVGLRGPFGSNWPVDAARGHDVVIVAGGIGLAPLRPVMYHAMNNRSDYGRIVLLYGARTAEDMLYQRELAEWRGRFDIEVHSTVDRSTTGWRGNVGVVTTLIPQAPCDPARTVAMVCGPEVMMRFTVMALEARGVAPGDIYVSMERNMKCAVGFCGHCQYGAEFICKDGPVFAYPRIERLFSIREV
jgi:NAD(P)H-flavin reductase